MSAARDRAGDCVWRRGVERQGAGRGERKALMRWGESGMLVSGPPYADRDTEGTCNALDAPNTPSRKDRDDG